MLKLWFAPNVWLHGSQSTITGGALGEERPRPRAIAGWFEHSMRCVLITPFGVPVEPDVNRIFATVSGVTAANARVDRGRSARAGRARRSAGGVERRSSARANAAPSAQTAPGASCATSARSFA